MRLALLASCCWGIVYVLALQAEDPEDQLRRRAMLGARLAIASDEVRQRQQLDEEVGVVLEHIFPGTSAAEGEFQAGDVVMAIDGVQMSAVSSLVDHLASRRAGDEVTIEFVRDGDRQIKRVTLKEMAREKGEGYEVIYGAVSNGQARLRTIVTRPKAAGRYPAVLMIQGGHTCYAIDFPFGNPTGFARIAHHLAEKGYVTMRVERPGCGDSEGGPIRDVDFDTELFGNTQALRALKRFDYVDPDNVFLFGHSMGGTMAPLMAVQEPVRGIAVFGTASSSWFESVTGQRRRLAALNGTNPADVDGEVLDQTRFWYWLTVEKKTPLEIRDQCPEVPTRIWNQWVTDDKYVSNRPYQFHHQLAERNMSDVWTRVAGTPVPTSGQTDTSDAPQYPRVLAIWGTSDWLAEKSPLAWIAEIVNRVHEGHGTFVELDSIDHFYFRTATPEESYRLMFPTEGTPPGEFNPNILATLLTWLQANRLASP